MPEKDLKDHARDGTDYYGLLNLNPFAAESEVRRAYRKVALKYHPDKNPGNAAALEKFHLLQIANDVLSDAEARGIYDATRRAKQEKEERERAFGQNRKRMIDALERGEKDDGEWAMKRRRANEEEMQAKTQVSQLREESAKRMKEKRKSMMEEDKVAERKIADDGVRNERGPPNGTANGSAVTATITEEDRAVKVSWKREGSGLEIGRDRLEEIFGRFGALEHVLVSKDKRKRLVEGQEKVNLGGAMLVFSSIASAYAAVEDASKVAKDGFDTLECVTWMRGQEPEAIQNLAARVNGDASTTNSPASTPSKEDATRIRLRMAAKRKQQMMEASKAANGGDGPGLRRVPSFASFRGTPASTPSKAPPPSFAGSPLVAQAEKVRSREEERRRMEAEIRQQEAEAAS